MINESFMPSFKILKRTAGIAILTGLASAITMPSAFAADMQTASRANTNAPKLILQITVDALRGDLPTRYYDRLALLTKNTLQHC